MFYFSSFVYIVYIGGALERDLLIASLDRMNDNNHNLFQCTHGHITIVLRQTLNCEPIL